MTREVEIAWAAGLFEGAGADELQRAHEVLDWEHIARGYYDDGTTMWVSYTLAARIQILTQRTLLPT